MWRRTLTGILLALAVAACGGGDGPTDPPEDTRPAKVVIVSATWRGVYSDGEHIDLTLRNDGGPGYFKLNAAATSTRTPGAAPPDWGTTDPTAVDAHWSEAVTITVQTDASAGERRVGKLTVYSRGSDSIVYAQTSQYIFP